MLPAQDCHFTYSRERLTKIADFNTRKKDWKRLPATSASKLCCYINHNSHAFPSSISSPVSVCVFPCFKAWLDLLPMPSIKAHMFLCPWKIPQTIRPDFAFIVVRAALLIAVLWAALKHDRDLMGALGCTTEIASHAVGVCVLYLL